MSNKKQIFTVSNKMELGENISDEAKGKGRLFVSRFIEPGVAHYQEFGDVLITKETLDKFINTMIGCPVIIQHKDIDDQNVDDERVGVVSKVWFNEADGWFYCEGIIWDKQAIDLVKNQDWNVSCTYDFDSDNQPKTHNGKQIDREFTDGEFLHLALVPNPRYERANIVMNAKDWDGNEGEWIKIHGNPIFIKKGQNKDEIVKDFISKLEQKSIKLKRKNGEEYNVTVNPELRDIDNFSKYYSDLNIYKNKLKDAGNLEDAKHIEEIMADIYEEVQYGSEKDDEIEKKAKGVIAFLTKYSGENAHVQVIDDKGYKFLINGTNTTGFSEKTAKDLADRLNANKQIKMDAKHKKQIQSKDWTVEVELKNRGDNCMTVLNELKEFIKNVVKNEKDEEMKEVKNEDKRKLIEEVGGILKGKVDDEIIRTILKKMEEASYEPSEDDKADNEADEEEKEEKFEEEKEIANNKKAKNEEELDEEIDEEIEKEEVENKCKNSMDDVKKIIMGGSSKVKSNYITKEERFALGENY